MRSQVLALLALLLAACASTPRASTDGSAGTLLLVGGGLDDDARPIYTRFVGLASARGPANILIATAATGTQADEVVDKTEALRVWAPGVPVRAILRETSTQETVAAIEAATAILFTGGGQKRITERYRPADADTPEWRAMQRLLARGGVIAGCSAGDAMMGELMLLGGGSAAALGIATKEKEGASAGAAPNAAPQEPEPFGPRVGPGMHFLPWAITDSHFFERDRVGRLVAALEATKTRLGIGVGEDGCVEVDLATTEVRGVGVSEALLVDVIHLQRNGLRRTNVLARPIQQGDTIALGARLAATPPLPRGLAQPGLREVPVVEPGQNRQLASWRLFRCAAAPGGEGQRLQLDGWQVLAWPASDDGEVVFEVGPR